MSKRILKSALAIAALGLLASGSIASAVKLNNASHARALARLQAPEVLVLPRVTVIGQRDPAALASNGQNRPTALR